MDPTLLIAGGGVAGFAALIVWLGKRGSAQAKKRQAAEEAALEEYGWKPAPSAPKSYVDLGYATPFRTGRERKASNVIRSKVGDTGFVSYEYEYVTERKDEDGKVQRTDHKYAITFIDIDGDIDEIRIMPEGMWDGKWDLDVESADFNKKWRVMAKDKRMAHALLSPTVIALLVDRETEKMPIVFEPGKIWTYSHGGHSFAKLARRVEVLGGIAKEIPAFVYKEAKAGKKPAAYVEPDALVDDPQLATPRGGDASAGGGRSVGGRSAGGASTGGRSVGGRAARGGSAGGRSTGGRSVGGSAAGRSGSRGGRSVGGSAAGGSGSRGGRSAGGSQQSGAKNPRGGRSAGGSRPR